MAAKRRSQAFWIAVIGMVIVIVIGLIIPNASTLGIGGTGILALLFIMRYVIPDIAGLFVDIKLKQEKRAVRGAVAEEVIEDILYSLGEDFVVFSDITCPNGNIDHVVIGKYSGVFLIETKSHHGKVEIINGSLTINGYPPEKDFIAQTLTNVYWLRDTIGQIVGVKPWIKAALVFTNAFVPRLQPVKGISIINKRFLLGMLQYRPNSSPENQRIWESRQAIIYTLTARTF